MAFTLISAIGTFIPASRDNLVANQALAGFASQDPTSQAALLQSSYAPIGYDFRALATTTIADAATVVLDLTARGMTLPANTQRTVFIDYYCSQASVAGVSGMRKFAIALTGAAGAPTITKALTLWLDVMSATITVNPTVVITGSNVTILVAGIAATLLQHEVRVYVTPLVATQ